MITQAGNDPNVKALVYVAAFAPKAGQSVGELVAGHASPPGLSRISDTGDGFLLLSQDGWVHDVGQDLPEDEARILAVVQPPLAKSTFADTVTEAAWATRPCWYVVSTEDRVVAVDLEREAAATMNATITELKASHLSLLSRPKEVADVIIDAVDTTAAASSQAIQRSR